MAKSTCDDLPASRAHWKAAPEASKRPARGSILDEARARPHRDKKTSAATRSGKALIRGHKERSATTTRARLTKVAAYPTGAIQTTWGPTEAQAAMPPGRM